MLHSIDSIKDDFVEVVIEEGSTTELPDENSILPSHKKYHVYDCKVDPSDGDRAYGLNILSTKRPHMRAFWCSNICNQISFLLWFSVNPLLLEIQRSLSLTKEEIWSSMIATFVGSLITRLIARPICDKYGARLPFVFFILATCIPALSICFIKSGTQLIIARFFLGIGGGAYVMCHFWLEAMFTKSYAGYIHCFSSAMGGVVGMTQLGMGAVAFPVASSISQSKEMGWRLSFIPVVVVAIIMAFFTILFSDDTPRGNISKLKREKNMNNASPIKLFKGVGRTNVWLISCQYLFNFGIEIILYSSLGMYFQDRYNISLLKSSIIVAVVGGSNQILRIIGGRISDNFYIKHGVKGRTLCQSRLVFLSGIFFIPLASAEKMTVACLWLALVIIFLSFAQAASFSLLGFMNENGATLEIIGCMGNVGAIIMAGIFRQFSYKVSLEVAGVSIMLSAFLPCLFELPNRFGFKFCCFGKCYDETSSKQTGSTESESQSENEDGSGSDCSSGKSIIGSLMEDRCTLDGNLHCPCCSVPILIKSSEGDPTCSLCGHLLSNCEIDKATLMEKAMKIQFVKKRRRAKRRFRSLVDRNSRLNKDRLPTILEYSNETDIESLEEDRTDDDSMIEDFGSHKIKCHTRWDSESEASQLDEDICLEGIETELMSCYQQD